MGQVSGAGEQSQEDYEGILPPRRKGAVNRRGAGARGVMCVVGRLQSLRGG